jgi:hypothetical protein
VTYPYLLPCAVAAVITLLGKQYEHGLDFPCRPQRAIGCILSLFLGHDGGSRESAIRLPPDKLDIPSPIPEEEDYPSP